MNRLASLGARMANRVLRHAGVEVRRLPQEPPSIFANFPDVEPWVATIIERVRPFTMTSLLRISALCHATRYVARAEVPGDIAECGVWRGGSMMAVALTLLAEGDLRHLDLYDTFGGMPPPKAVDRSVKSGRSAASVLEDADKSSNVWAIATLDEVRSNLESTVY
ncbi:MAG: TylF/MycF/NovP-related O-methyltransferase, partial [Acetobacteraceae bacterium]